MTFCNQNTIGNGFLDKLMNLEELNMTYCQQDSIGNGFLDKLTNL